MTDPYFSTVTLLLPEYPADWLSKDFAGPCLLLHCDGANGETVFVDSAPEPEVTLLDQFGNPLQRQSA